MTSCELILDFDPQVFGMFFSATLGLFAVGFGVGIIFGQFRRLSR